MARKPWLPNSLPAQQVLVQNIRAKIVGYAGAFGLAAEQISASQALCDAFIGAFNLAEQSRSTMQVLRQWRDIVFFGEPAGEPAPDPPVFPTGGSPGYANGIVKQFFAFRDLVISLPGCTDSIGEDLAILGPEITPTPEASVAPDLRVSVSNGNFVNLTGSMQGLDAMRVEYSPKGGQFATIAFLTKTPGGFAIDMAEPDKPQAGHFRAIFVKKNADYGNYSPAYAITIF